MKFTTTVKLKRGTKGQKALAPAKEEVEPGRIPRVAKLMALAIKFDQMIRDGIVRDQAGLARLGHVTRARVTQIMNLLTLAPDIQEELLFLPATIGGDDDVNERDLRPIAAKLSWVEQHKTWSMANLRKRCHSSD